MEMGLVFPPFYKCHNSCGAPPGSRFKLLSLIAASFLQAAIFSEITCLSDADSWIYNSMCVFVSVCERVWVGACLYSVSVCMHLGDIGETANESE